MVGSIMGLCVASLGLLGLGGLFFFLGEGHYLEGFGMGASVVALFRVLVEESLQKVLT